MYFRVDLSRRVRTHREALKKRVRTYLRTWVWSLKG